MRLFTLKTWRSCCGYPAILLKLFQNVVLKTALNIFIAHHTSPKWRQNRRDRDALVGNCIVSLLRTLHLPPNFTLCRWVQVVGWAPERHLGRALCASSRHCALQSTWHRRAGGDSFVQNLWDIKYETKSTSVGMTLKFRRFVLGYIDADLCK